MSSGRKLLVGIGALISLFSIAFAASALNQTSTTSVPTVLSANATASPMASPVATPAPTLTPSTLVTPTLKPAPATRIAPTSVSSVATPIPEPQAADSSESGSGYINSEGNYVPSPVHADTPPAGATAQCADGTYSFSQYRSGTCSHHGGVAQWL